MRVRTAIPATVANLGPGFDVLAVALQLQNDVRAQSVAEGITVDPGVGAPEEFRDPRVNLVTRSYMTAVEEMDDVEAAGVHFECTSRIPVARGLGSSAAAALAGVLTAVALHHAPWDEHRVLDLVARIEGHADNAAAALLGGLAISAPLAHATTMAVPERVRAVVFVPDAPLATGDSRAVVPVRLSRQDAVFNAGRCALLVRALALEDYAGLAEAMDDRWHQQARSRLVPAAAALMHAARAAGAAGAALAGAGPSIIALTAGDAAPVAAAMDAAAREAGVPGSAAVYAIRNFGARVDVSP